MLAAVFPPSTTSPAEVVDGEEGGYRHRFFAFELDAVEGKAALAGGDAEVYITRADLRLRGNRISESLGHGYGLLVQSALHSFFIGEVDSGAHRFCDPHGLRGVCADLRTSV